MANIRPALPAKIKETAAQSRYAGMREGLKTELARDAEADHSPDVSVKDLMETMKAAASQRQIAAPAPTIKCSLKR